MSLDNDLLYLCYACRCCCERYHYFAGTLDSFTNCKTAHLTKKGDPNLLPVNFLSIHPYSKIMVMIALTSNLQFMYKYHSSISRSVMTLLHFASIS